MVGSENGLLGNVDGNFKDFFLVGYNLICSMCSALTLIGMRLKIEIFLNESNNDVIMLRCT